MLGPGEYVPDVTEGITRVEDLPKPRIERRSRNYPARRCRRCGRRAGRYTDFSQLKTKEAKIIAYPALLPSFTLRPSSADGPCTSNGTAWQTLD